MQSDPRLRVLEHELITVRGIRIGRDIDLADAAVQRERELQVEIDQRKREVEAMHEDELPAAVSFACQDTPTEVK